jgi:hypothetical protein
MNAVVSLNVCCNYKNDTLLYLQGLKLPVNFVVEFNLC